ncbi:hypothetical protein CVT26_000677, partial [Gymnopilus dilepis]
MSLSLLQQPFPVPSLRKRTSSFSCSADLCVSLSPNPRPCKSPRVANNNKNINNSMVSPLRRSETMLSIPSGSSDAATTTPNPNAATITSTPTTTTRDKDAATYRVLQRHKEDRLRRKGLTRTHSEYFDFTSRPRLELAPPKPAPTSAVPPTPVASSSSSTSTASTASAVKPTPSPKSAAPIRPRKS